ncbi:MAG: hypothetical protein QOK02_4680 [Mycobacterium sp.]|nr:hypothetical protein [Mycobacterium sp.]
MSQPAPLVFSAGFGLLMVAATAVRGDEIALICAGLAALALVVGIRYLSCATLSVLLVVVSMVMSDPPPLVAALAGLSAGAYLVIRHAAEAGVVTTTRPTVIGMVAFTVVGIVATTTPMSVPWLPLLAPPAVVVIFILVMVPFLRSGKGSAWKT